MGEAEGQGQLESRGWSDGVGPSSCGSWRGRACHLILVLSYHHTALSHCFWKIESLFKPCHKRWLPPLTGPVDLHWQSTLGSRSQQRDRKRSLFPTLPLNNGLTPLTGPVDLHWQAPRLGSRCQQDDRKDHCFQTCLKLLASLLPSQAPWTFTGKPHGLGAGAKR